jgi:hypothetical protein
MFWDAVRSLEPSLYKGFNPWDEITEPAALLDLFERAGIVDAAVEPAEGTQPLDRPEDFWVMVMGGGLRATVDALAPAQQDQVRDEVLTRVREDALAAVRVDTVLGTARRP